MRSKFLKDAETFQNKHPGDGTIIGGNTILPLYWDLPKNSSHEPWSSCDLKHVLTLIVKAAKRNNTNIMYAFFICLSAVSCARGGEGKFLKTADWDFDAYLGILNTPWPDIKTHQNYAMPQCPSSKWFSDFYFWFAAFMLCENGLFRSEEN